MKTKTILFSILALILYFSNAHSNKLGAQPTTINAGAVSGIWNKAGSPYLVQGDITVPAGQKLTITEGVKVEFQGQYRLRVYGSIQALGKANDTVLFTAANPSAGWQGITVYGNTSTTDSVIFDYSKIEYGRNFKYNFKIDTGVVHIQDHSKVRISNSFFYKNKGNRYNGVRVVNCSLTMYNCNFKENEAIDERVNGDNAALNCLVMQESNGILENCIFEQNKCWSPNNPNDSATGLAGSTCNFFSSNVDILNCIFRSNYATTAGTAASIVGTNSIINFNNCNFINNYSREGKVIFCSFGNNGGNKVTLNNCLFDGNVSMQSDGTKPVNLNITLSHELIHASHNWDGVNKHDDISTFIHPEKPLYNVKLGTNYLMVGIRWWNQEEINTQKEENAIRAEQGKIARAAPLQATKMLLESLVKPEYDKNSDNEILQFIKQQLIHPQGKKIPFK